LVAASELDEGLDESRLSGASFNISSAEEVTIRELAELVLEVSGSSSEIVSVKGHPGDSVRRTADVSAAESALGWKPTVDLRSGLERTWGWLQEGV
jgi:nucleoside-diphosphate-sugar epimerase